MTTVWGIDAHILQALDTASKCLFRYKTNRAPLIFRVIKAIATPSAFALLKVYSASGDAALKPDCLERESHR